MNCQTTRISGLAFTLLLIFTAPAWAYLFHETFDGYPNIQHNPGIPEISEGADEYWYGGRFEAFDNGTIDDDLAVRYVWSENYARMEDESGILFNISTMGLSDVVLSFDWKTHNLDFSDVFVAGYYIGELGFDQGDNRFRDFFTDDFGLSQTAAVSWWNTDWTELLRDRGRRWHHFETMLPENQESIWVAFWLDGGECNYGKVDNVIVTPEPSTLLLLGLGITLLRRRLIGNP